VASSFHSVAIYWFTNALTSSKFIICKAKINLTLSLKSKDFGGGNTQLMCVFAPLISFSWRVKCDKPQLKGGAMAPIKPESKRLAKFDKFQLINII